MMSSPATTQRGMTLIELIVVIVICSVLSAGVVYVLKPAGDGYRDLRVRADLTDQADMAVRRMMRDVRRAVPNSIRMPSSQCFELVPVVGGSRYRAGPDLHNDATSCTPLPTAPTSPASTCSAWVDTSQATVALDTLSPMVHTPVAGDWVVIDNQNGNDVYVGLNRAAIVSVANTASSSQGVLRLTISPLQVSPGYTGGRFQVVASTEPAVAYVCSGADGNLDSQGNGKGTLYRVVRSFDPIYPTTCPNTAGGSVVATRVKTCNFVYDANHGGTQDNGYVWMELELARNNEASRLVLSSHVLNTP